MDANSKPGTGGWGVATGIILLALALIAAAYTIHVKTFCNPAHPMCNATSAESGR